MPFCDRNSDDEAQINEIVEYVTLMEQEDEDDAAVPPQVKRNVPSGCGCLASTVVAILFIGAVTAVIMAG